MLSASYFTHKYELPYSNVCSMTLTWQTCEWTIKSENESASKPIDHLGQLVADLRYKARGLKLHLTGISEKNSTALYAKRMAVGFSNHV